MSKTLKLLALLAVLNLGIFGVSLLSTPPGDYRAFYAAGRMPRGEVYSWDEQRRFQSHVSGRTFLPFFHPPIEEPLFRLVSRPSYERSLILWRGLSAVFLILSCCLLAASLDLPKLEIAALAFALAPVWQCFYVGQDTMLTLLIMSATLYLLRQDREALAGALLALSLFKPPVPLLVAATLMLIGKRRFCVAFASCAALLASLCALWMGKAGILEMIDCARRAEEGLLIRCMPNLRGLMCLAVGDHPRTASLLGVLVLLVAFTLWDRGNTEDAFLFAVPLALFVSPHTFVYDLSLLVMPLAIALRKGRATIAFPTLALASGPLFLFAINALALFALPVLSSLRLTKAAEFPADLR